MGPILVAGFPQGSSLGLVAAFEWLGQPYRVARVDMLKDMKTEAFTRLNGRQETPGLVKPDGSCLTETTAIAAWLEARNTDRRISFDPKSADADRMHRMLAFMNTSFTSAFSSLWAAMEMKPDLPLQEILRKHGRASVFKRHAHLEAMLDDRPFIFGDHPTLADGVFIGVARWAEFHQIDVSAFSRITSLKRGLEDDPAVIFAHAVEDGKAPRGSGACAGYVTLEDVTATG